MTARKEEPGYDDWLDEFGAHSMCNHRLTPNSRSTEMNTARQKVMRRCDEIGATVQKLDSPLDVRSGAKLEVIAPEGQTFDGLTGLICTSWEDALERLGSATLIPDEDA